MDNFNIACRFFEADEYDTVFEMVQAKYTDVGVVNRLYGNREKAFYKIEETPVIFNPIEMRFAVPQGSNEEITAKIDAHLLRFKEDQTSIYYQSINRWFVVDSDKILPKWLVKLLYAAIAVALFLFVVALLFRYQISRKTIELKIANIQLQKEIEEKKELERNYVKLPA